MINEAERNTNASMASILLRLPDHLHTFLISTVGFAVVHHLAAPEFARFLLGKKAWDVLGVRERVGWCVVILGDSSRRVGVRADKKSPCAFHLQAVACGVARPCFVDPPTRRAMPAYSRTRCGPRVRMGPTCRHALRRYERVSALQSRLECPEQNKTKQNSPLG